MKKAISIASLSIALLTLVFTLTSCGECEKCDGSGMVKEWCYYENVAEGYRILDGANISHDDLCHDVKCRGYSWVDCKACNGTGKQK